MPSAFKTVIVRLFVFFVLCSLATGIVIPSNDEILLSAINEDKAGKLIVKITNMIYWYCFLFLGAAQSPYVAAMIRLKIGVLPHIVNVGIATSSKSVYSSNKRIK